MSKNMKNKIKEKAIHHTNIMHKIYKEEIMYSIKNTKLYTEEDIILDDKIDTNQNIELIATDSVDAAFRYNNKVCILNFASYKKPGGGFINGSIAQEECLCHESTLYNVLKTQYECFYNENKLSLKNGLYSNRALYSPNIIFEYDSKIKKVDVLTCAAPNYAYAKTKNIGRKLNSTVLRNRIRFILSIIYKENVDTVILGAFGCGVFGQNPKEVSKIFKEEISNIFGNSNKTKFIFAIPNENGENYTQFSKVLC